MSNVANLWNRVKFYCNNPEHNDPIELIIMKGSTEFFACPKYMVKDEAHPLGRERDELACNNRLSFESALSIVEALEKIIAESGPSADLTNCTFKPGKMSAIECTVLQYDMTCIKVGIVNRRALVR